MKILYLSNNSETDSLYTWLSEKEESVLKMEHPLTLDWVKEMNPDLIVSYNYRHIIKKDVIQYMDGRIINLHISLLPWNRGASPNVWSFLEDSPKGVTIHLIDEGLDTGDILVQQEVYFDESAETFKTSYSYLHKVIQQLFIDNWEAIKQGKIVAKKQEAGCGSYHTMKDLEKLREKCPFSFDDNIAWVKRNIKRE